MATSGIVALVVLALVAGFAMGWSVHAARSAPALAAAQAESRAVRDAADLTSRALASAVGTPPDGSRWQSGRR